MKFFKDLAAFAVNDVGILFVVCSLLFTVGITVEFAKCCSALRYGEFLFAVTTAIMVFMDALAVRLAWEDFQDFREER